MIYRVMQWLRNWYNKSHLSRVQRTAEVWGASGLGTLTEVQEKSAQIAGHIVKRGSAMQQKVQVLAEKQLTGVSQGVSTIATGLQFQANQQWNKIQPLAQQGLAKTKENLPSEKDLQNLASKIGAVGKKLQTAATQTTASVTKKVIGGPDPSQSRS